MKALWLSNVDIALPTMSGSGTWVMAMASALCDNFADVEICNISLSNEASRKSLYDGRISQHNVNRSDKNTEAFVNETIQRFKPDIIHIWGTESKWCAFPFIDLNCSILIDMQGVVSTVYENFYGGLSGMELFRCITLKEIIKPTSSLPISRRPYRKIAKVEAGVIAAQKYISVQSDWVEAHVRAINPDCKVYHTGIALRPDFYRASKWQKPSQRVIFSTATMVSPLKGLHTLLRALAIIKRTYPDVMLRLAGSVQTGLRVGGYAKFLRTYIRKHDLQRNIVFLGELDTDKLIQEYRNASVFVNPSSIESYSLVVAEAMHIGTPTVATFTGGMSELGADGKSILYFPKEDPVCCAHKILRLLTNPDYAEKISDGAIRHSEYRNDYSRIAKRQLEIYQTIISKESNIR